MSKNKAIEICLRVRPTPQVDEGFFLNQDDCKAQFATHRRSQRDVINNMVQKYVFPFNQVFDSKSVQAKIFDKVAKQIIDAAIEGYNGTVFAYGQTGSGKTFTMTGDTDNYQNRGLIPRTIEYLFSQKKSKDIKITISYFQIYNQDGYDLLQEYPKNQQQLRSLPKVKPMESATGQLQIKNLSIHQPSDIEQAINLLFVGDTNRIVKKTSMNDQSTRSHCIFTFHLQTSSPGSDIKKEAFFHLVDLSGSQRIKRTGVTGILEDQARKINTSLHHLERVIVCLNQAAQGRNVHIPYRDSLMTFFLKDALGGNCKTRMIATMSPKSQDIMQSITTCKFAQRVALISNQMQRNQTVDKAVIIQRLLSQNAKLKAQLALLKGTQVKDALEKYQIDECRQKIQQYIQAQTPVDLIFKDRLLIQQAFSYLRSLVREGKMGSRQGFLPNKSSTSEIEKNGQRPPNSEKPVRISSQDAARYQEQIKKLKMLLLQKQNQINILLSIAQKVSQGGNYLTIPANRQQNSELLRSIIQPKQQIIFPAQLQQKRLQQKRQSQTSQMVQKSEVRSNISKYESEIQRMLSKPLNLSSEQMHNQALAFEQFRKHHRKQQTFQQNKQILQKKMDEGKELGRAANQSKIQVEQLKVRLAGIRQKMNVQSLASGQEVQVDPEQHVIQQQILRLKEVNKAKFNRLRQVKAEIQSIQALAKKNAEILQKDFEKYLELTYKMREDSTQQMEPSSIMASSIKDDQVKNKLNSFYKARDQMRRR